MVIEKIELSFNTIEFITQSKKMESSLDQLKKVISQTKEQAKKDFSGLITKSESGGFTIHVDKMRTAVENFKKNLFGVETQQKKAFDEKKAGIWAGATAGAIGLAGKAAEKLAERFLQVAESNKATSDKMAEFGKLIDNLLKIGLPLFNKALDATIYVLNNMAIGLNALGINGDKYAKDLDKQAEANKKLTPTIVTVAEQQKLLADIQAKEAAKAEERKKQAEERWRQIVATAKAYEEVAAATRRAAEWELKHTTIVAQAAELTDLMMATRRDMTHQLVDEAIPGLVSYGETLGDIQDITIEYTPQVDQMSVALDKMAKIAGQSAMYLAQVFGAAIGAIKPLSEFAKGNAAGGITSILSSFQAGASALSAKLSDMGKNIGASLLGALAGGIGIVVQLVSVLFSKEFQALAGKIPGIISKTIESLPGLASTALQILDEILAGMPALLDGLLNMLPDFIKSALLKVADSIDVLVPKMIDLGIAIAVGIVQAMPEIIKAIVLALPEIITSLAKGLGDLLLEILYTLIPKLRPDEPPPPVDPDASPEEQAAQQAAIDQYNADQQALANTRTRGNTQSYADTPGVMRSTGDPMTLMRGDYFVASQSLAGLETMTGASNKQRDYQIRLQMATLDVQKEMLSKIDRLGSSSNIYQYAGVSVSRRR